MTTKPTLVQRAKAFHKRAKKAFVGGYVSAAMAFSAAVGVAATDGVISGTDWATIGALTLAAGVTAWNAAYWPTNSTEG